MNTNEMLLLADKYTEDTMSLAKSFGFKEEEFAVLSAILNAVTPVENKRAVDMLVYMKHVMESKIRFEEEVKESGKK